MQVSFVSGLNISMNKEETLVLKSAMLKIVENLVLPPDSKSYDSTNVGFVKRGSKKVKKKVLTEDEMAIMKYISTEIGNNHK